MELKRYSEYFFIDPFYYPHIDTETKNDPNSSWMTTYPHESFIDLMKNIVRMLSRETNSAKTASGFKVHMAQASLVLCGRQKRL